MRTAAHPNVPQIMLPGQAAAAPGPLDMSNMYLAHFGFRRDLGHLITAAGRVRLDDRRRVTALREHHAWVLFVLHHHHTAEDETVWPRLRERAPESVGTIDALEAEHEACDRWLSESTAAFQAFEAAPSEPGRERLMTALRGLADTLGAHLAHEETDGIPLMMAHITPEEDAEMHKAIMKEYGLGRLVRLLGWITAELPPDVEAHLRRTAPRPMLLLSRLAGGRYRRRAAYLWG
ncbi:hemerythrin domain-containing protein [Nonomuraea rhodomycinica]|uniref:Hemerythrin domain-containing protein n=1 Tax=Nonomuraea rhodomycinica TaxID=1712872 RepID=A0A7Y6IRJ3_9ACTN|nr:hemerythrin domain-containing protein [Nonomuraea rhodomycinica]NUW43091.1 hemerythrin domain-containing protein [Nonomuraea rhodomycinica]